MDADLQPRTFICLMGSLENDFAVSGSSEVPWLVQFSVFILGYESFLFVLAFFPHVCRPSPPQTGAPSLTQEAIHWLTLSGGPLSHMYLVI